MPKQIKAAKQTANKVAWSRVEENAILNLQNRTVGATVSFLFAVFRSSVG